MESYVGLAEGDTFQAAGNAIITDAGTERSTIRYSITRDGENVENNYAVILNEGTLTVTKKRVRAEFLGGSKVYDGVALTKQDVQNLIYCTEQIELKDCNLIGVKDAGKYVINADFGENYDVVFESATYTILRKPLTLRYGGSMKSNTPAGRTEWVAASYRY